MEGARAQEVDGNRRTVPEYAPLIPASATTHITSTVDDASGASYVTGTFEGQVTIGDSTIQSHGDKDVFLLKVDPRGRFVWLRAVGSVSAESGPHVTLEDGTGHVHLLGTTNGKMSCGSGPLPAWSSEAFFFCVFGADDGTPLSGGVFPTGAP